MRQLQFDSTSFRCDDQRVFLISGELHYFRVPHQGWRDRLQKLKDAGGNCAATYVPWLLHEPQEGTFVFGEAQLDFEHFLELCNEVGLWAVVRPGPYVYSELLHGGLPDWLLRNYPQVLARRLDGSPINTDLSVSYLHPTFLGRVRRWFDQVVPLLARYQTSQGGAVAAVQIDNELMGIHEWFGSWDYHPDSMGVGREQGRWAHFLRERYATLEALNSSWAANFTDWASAAPIDAPSAGTLAEMRRLKDYNDFYFSAAAEYMTLLGGWLRELGIDVPLMHNSGGPGMNAYFEPTVRRMADSGEPFLLGSDHYYNLGLDWGDGTHPTHKYASKAFYSLAMLRHLGSPPTVLEMPGGSAAEFPPILPGDVECAYLTNLAFGMKGYNIYVFAGGANPPGAADPNVGMANYDYGAGISPTGELRELYYIEKMVAEWIHARPWLASAQRAADCRLGLVREYARSAHFGRDERAMRTSPYAAWTLMRKGLMMTALNASLSPELIDMDSDDWLDDTSTPVMLACSDSLSRKIQERLVRFLQSGGNLLIAPGLPTLDEWFQPCAILADAVGAAGAQRPSGAVDAAWDACTGQVIGWQMQIDGGGALLVLERSWTIARRWEEALLRGALLRLGCQPMVECSNPNVWTSLLSDGNQAALFLLNLFTGPLSASVRYRHPAGGAWIDAGTHILPPISVTTLDAPSQTVME